MYQPQRLFCKHPATHGNPLQQLDQLKRVLRHTLQHNDKSCNSFAHCNTMTHGATATQCHMVQLITMSHTMPHRATPTNLSQHTAQLFISNHSCATHCNTLQHVYQLERLIPVRHQIRRKEHAHLIRHCLVKCRELVQSDTFVCVCVCVCVCVMTHSDGTYAHYTSASHTPLSPHSYQDMTHSYQDMTHAH